MKKLFFLLCALNVFSATQTSTSRLSTLVPALRTAGTAARTNVSRRTITTVPKVYSTNPLNHPQECFHPSDTLKITQLQEALDNIAARKRNLEALKNIKKPPTNSAYADMYESEIESINAQLRQLETSEEMTKVTLSQYIKPDIKPGIGNQTGNSKDPGYGSCLLGAGSHLTYYLLESGRDALKNALGFSAVFVSVGVKGSPIMFPYVLGKVLGPLIVLLLSVAAPTVKATVLAPITGAVLIKDTVNKKLSTMSPDEIKEMLNDLRQDATIEATR